jgi:uncharacterized protein
MAVVIFKAVEKCNSNCIYCDVIKKQQNQIMDFNLLELIFKKMNEYLIANPEERIAFTWHGGEVCLLGADYFRRAIEIQDTYCTQTKSRIDHQVQSNLTLINQDIIDMFKQLGIKQIGSSFEPIPHMRGFGKKRDSETYNRKFMNGVNLLNKNHFTWGIIYVVHRKSLEMPLEIFYYLTNLNIRSHPNFNQIKMFGEDKHNLDISGEEFADFLGAIFPEWWKNRHRYPNVQPFARFTQYIQDHTLSLVCELSGSCSHKWLYIGPDGETSQCGRAGDYNIFQYGNIKDRSFQEIMQDGKRDQFLERQIQLPKTECKDCRFWGICHGGCPLDAYMIYQDFTHRSPSCDAVRIFIERYFEPITGLKADFRPENISFN